MQDYRSLPKLRDSISHLYVEHARVDKEAQSIALQDKDGIVSVPVSALTLLMLGPGTTITHQAVKVLADSGCLTVWCGEGGIRYYAHGLGETRKGYKLERQARLWADEEKHMAVVRAMYFKRLGLRNLKPYNLEQLRGMEGARVRDSYAQMSRETGVPWKGRQYDRSAWNRGDEVNRALSTANSCLYGLCHAAIISGGYSPGLGFIHSGKQLSFVYDIADLYKMEVTVPVAFNTVKEGPEHLERTIRKNCRDQFFRTKLLSRILPDIDELFNLGERADELPLDDWPEDEDPARPAPYWGSDRDSGGEPW